MRPIKFLGSRPVSESARDYLSRALRPHTPSQSVARRQIPYWQDRGWKHEGNIFSGSYQTPYGAFQGWIEERGGNTFNFFIYSPPQEMKQHSHWSCFQSRGSDWYLVHMSRRPTDVSSGILTIERLLMDAFEKS